MIKKGLKIHTLDGVGSLLYCRHWKIFPNIKILDEICDVIRTENEFLDNTFVWL